jgi:hypothetical protein
MVYFTMSLFESEETSRNMTPAPVSIKLSPNLSPSPTSIIVSLQVQSNANRACEGKARSKHLQRRSASKPKDKHRSLLPTHTCPLAAHYAIRQQAKSCKRSSKPYRSAQKQAAAVRGSTGRRAWPHACASARHAEQAP